MPTYIISVPPSANHLFHNLRNGGRRKTRKYISWIDGELKALMAQRAKPVPGGVSVKLTIPKSTRGDMDNRIKPALDLLVRAGIIADDRSEFVRSISMTIGDVQMMHVQIEPVAA